MKLSADGKPHEVETSFRARLPLALESERGSRGATCGRASRPQWNLITPGHPVKWQAGGWGGGGGARGWVESSSP